MGNEMGNSNVTGLAASELDNAEAAEAIMSLDSLEATEKNDAEDTATNEPSKDVIVSIGAGMTNKANEANLEEKHMESIGDDPKKAEEQKQQESSDEKATEQEAEDLATNKSLIDSIISNITDATNIVNQANPHVVFDQDHLLAEEAGQNQQKSSEEKEEEMRSNSALDTLSRKEETPPIVLVDRENNERAEKLRITSAESCDVDLQDKNFSDENSPEFTEKTDQIEDAMREKIDESSITDSVSLQENNIKDSLHEATGSCVDNLLEDSNVVNGNDVEIDHDEFHEEDEVGNNSSTESIDTIFLDAIDSEVKALLIEKGEKETDQSSPNIDPDENGMNIFPINGDCPEGASPQTKIDDSMVGNYSTQFSATSPGQEEKLDKEDGRPEYSLFEQLIQTKEIDGIDSETVIESQHVKEEDRHVEEAAYNPSMINEKKMENKGEELNDEHEHIEDKLASSMSDALAISSEDDNMKEKEDLDAEDAINTTPISNDAADLEEHNKSSRDLLSTLLEPERSKDENMIKQTKDPKAGGNGAEERSEGLGKVFGSQIEVPDISMSKEEHVYDLNLVGTASSASYQSKSKSKSDDMDKSSILLQQQSPNYSKEVEEQRTAAESTTVTSDGPFNESVISICAVRDINNCLNISSEVRAISDESNSEVNPFLTQENEVPAPENSEATLNFAKQPRDCSSTGEAALRAVNDVSITAEPNQDKLTLQGEESIKNGFYLEKSSAEIINSAPKSPTKDCEKAPLLHPTESANCLIDASERGDYGDQKTPTSTADISEVKRENHEKTARHDTSGSETSASDTTEAAKDDVGEQTTASALESGKEESDKSPLLGRKNSKERELASFERKDSRKLRIPLLSLMKEDVFAAESSDDKEGLAPKEVVAMSPKGRGKQKPRSSLFSNCMCCTTATN